MIHTTSSHYLPPLHSPSINSYPLHSPSINPSPGLYHVWWENIPQEWTVSDPHCWQPAGSFLLGRPHNGMPISISFGGKYYGQRGGVDGNLSHRSSHSQALENRIGSCRLAPISWSHYHYLEVTFDERKLTQSVYGFFTLKFNLNCVGQCSLFVFLVRNPFTSCLVKTLIKPSVVLMTITAD